jgi:hypothetical protein
MIGDTAAQNQQAIRSAMASNARVMQGESVPKDTKAFIGDGKSAGRVGPPAAKGGGGLAPQIPNMPDVPEFFATNGGFGGGSAKPASGKSSNNQGANGIQNDPRVSTYTLASGKPGK